MTRSRDAVGAKITVPISHIESEVIDVSERKKTREPKILY